MFASGPNPRIRDMATSSHTTMLREFAAAGEGGRTGALDVEWEGARASFFFKLGTPTHLVFDAPDGRRLDGLLALDALVDELPTEFQMAPEQRHGVRRHLHRSPDELMELFSASAPNNGHTAGSNGHGPAQATGTPLMLRPSPTGCACLRYQPRTASSRRSVSTTSRASSWGRRCGRSRSPSWSTSS